MQTVTNAVVRIGCEIDWGLPMSAGKPVTPAGRRPSRRTLASIILLLVLRLPALAASSDCVGDNFVEAARRIAACTHMIEDPTEPAYNHSAAYFKRGNAWVAQHDYDRAIADYDQVINLDPSFADAYYNRGIVLFHKGADDRALADFDKAISLDPKDADARNHRGLVWVRKGDYDRAIAEYDQAIAHGPKSCRA